MNNFKWFLDLNDLGDIKSKSLAEWSILLKNTPNKVKPLSVTEDKKEDLSDPEEELIVADVKESVPTCPNVVELINLIISTDITRKINKIFFHCTATSQKATVSAIQKYWKENLKWNNPGYHIIVKPDGSWTLLQDFNKVTNGVAGHNSDSLHFSYIGGIDSKGKGFDNRTKEQIAIFEALYIFFNQTLPNAKFYGHYSFSKKECPSFNVEDFIKSIKK